MSNASNCSAQFGVWGAPKQDPSGTGQVFLAAVTSGFLIIIGATTAGKRLHSSNHQLAGYMLMGFFASDHMRCAP